ETPIHLKNFGGNQSPLNSHQALIDTHHLEISNDASSINHENPSTLSNDESISDSNNDTLVLEQQNQSQPEIPIEEISNHQESLIVESKKQKNSLFFNLFRK
ncbi:MAG TPA: hypothetical protein VIH12_09265, partial [Solibacillus sp.]